MQKHIASWSESRDVWESNSQPLAVYSETFPPSGMTLNGELYEPLTSEPPHQRERIFVLAHKRGAHTISQLRQPGGRRTPTAPTTLR